MNSEYTREAIKKNGVSTVTGNGLRLEKKEAFNMKHKTLANKQQAEENTPGSVQIMNKGSAAEETAKAHQNK